MKNNQYERDQNLVIKFVYFLDRYTSLLEKIEKNRAKWLLDNFPLHKWIGDSEKILDIGSGIGDIDTLLSQNNNNNKIYGIDIIDYRRRGIRQLNKYHFVRASGYTTPFQNSTFDSVLILVTLHHMNTPELALEEALRVLKKGGNLFVLEDIIGPPGSYLKFITLFIDNLINLSLKGNPNTNKTEGEWEELLSNHYLLEKINSYTLKWGPLMKSLKLGIFWYKK